MKRLVYNIIGQKSASETLSQIATLYHHHIDGNYGYDFNKSEADLASLFGDWSLDDTTFMCLGLTRGDAVFESGWLHIDPGFLKSQMDETGQDLYLLVANYNDVAIFDEDTTTKQRKFKNYSGEDTKLVLVNWALEITEGSKASIPISFIDVLPSRQVEKIKLPK